MSRLTDLIAQLDTSSPDLAQDLRREVNALSRRRPFGLNFERHIPETVQLPSRRLRRGDKVVFRARPGEPNEDLDRRVWLVVSFQGKGMDREANLLLRTDSDDPETAARRVSDLVVVAEFRDPIYPGLRSAGTVEGGGAKPFHTVINGENYHVLEALSFVYPGTVDCVYIDPPYNGREKDWKYNNDYVDPNDDYAHSKWLAFMERRLLLAKTLLNPASSSLIVTIDENEYMRLALLLEQTFPEATIQMVTSVVSAKGAVRPGRFSRVEEYIFFVTSGDAQILPWTRNMLDSDSSADRQEADDDDAEEADDEGAGGWAEDQANGHGPGASSELKVGQPIEWLGLRRREPSSVRGSRPNQFFPFSSTRQPARSRGSATQSTMTLIAPPCQCRPALWRFGRSTATARRGSGASLRKPHARTGRRDSSGLIGSPRAVPEPCTTCREERSRASSPER